jgi:hypothetical protein
MLEKIQSQFEATNEKFRIELAELRGEVRALRKDKP